MTKNQISEGLDFTLRRIFDLARNHDKKPIGAMLGKVFEEGGELAEAVNHHEGHLPHKTMKEPLVGEVADLVQCALALLVKAHPTMTDDELMVFFSNWLAIKTNKWENTLPPRVNPFAAVVLNKPVATPPVCAQTIQHESRVMKPVLPGKKPAVILEPAKPQVTKPKLSILIRKHPKGVTQPTGERVVTRFERVNGGTMVQLGIGPGGKQGWQLDIEKDQPSFLTFRIGSSKQPVSMKRAFEYWQTAVNGNAAA